MAVIFKQLFVIMAVMFTTNGIEDSCLTFSELSCTRGTKRGLTTQNSRETRLIPAMEFNCTGTLMGLTVSGRNGTGTMYPKLQIWRRSSTDANLYFKNGPEIQIDAHGSACETLTRNENCSQEFHCRLPAANHVPISAGVNIIGVELPPFNNQRFELLFVISEQLQHVWRREVTSSSLMIGTQDITVQDNLFLNVEVLQESDNISSQLNSNGRNYSETIGTGTASCLVIGATVGGAVGTPLLLLIILLLVILTCVIKRSSDKSEITTQNNEAYGESGVTVVFDEKQRMSVLKSSFHASEDKDTMYATVQ